MAQILSARQRLRDRRKAGGPEEPRRRTELWGSRADKSIPRAGALAPPARARSAPPRPLCLVSPSLTGFPGGSDGKSIFLQ